MKVVVFSDIHGNALALKAVLSEMKDLDVEHILVLGDFVGYYYHPDEVLRLLGSFKTTYVRGNHEHMLEEVRENPEAAEKIQKKYGHGISEALKLLSVEQLDMLAQLPNTVTLELGGKRFFLCHGSPWKNDECIYPDASRETLKKCAAIDSDFVLMGHTHYPLFYTGGRAILVNPGSVGQSRDKGGAASWAVIDTRDKSVVFKRTAFDIVPLIAEVQKFDPGVAYLTDVLRR